jgi:hypothetical protein
MEGTLAGVAASISFCVLACIVGQASACVSNSKDFYIPFGAIIYG